MKADELQDRIGELEQERDELRVKRDELRHVRDRFREELRVANANKLAVEAQLRLVRGQRDSALEALETVARSGITAAAAQIGAIQALSKIYGWKKGR
jgi:uncharacterized coiled-coil DUF342 family protein